MRSIWSRRRGQRPRVGVHHEPSPRRRTRNRIGRLGGLPQVEGRFDADGRAVNTNLAGRGETRRLKAELP